VSDLARDKRRERTSIMMSIVSPRAGRRFKKALALQLLDSPAHACEEHPRRARQGGEFFDTRTCALNRS
jgi:hypothetical protein